MKPTERVTLAVLAAELGVHKATVSRALRGDPRVNEKTRVTVQELAAARGFRPDPALSALSEERWRRRNRNATSNWAVLDLSNARIPLAEHPHFMALPQCANTLGYTLTHVRMIPEEPMSVVNRTLRARAVRGVIMLPMSKAVSAKVAWDKLAWDAFSWVAMDHGNHISPLHRVSFDAFRNTRTALQAMADHGCKRFVFVRGLSEISWINIRQEAAFLQFQAENPDLDLLDAPSTMGRIDNDAVERHRPDALLLGYTGLRQSLSPALSRLPWATLSALSNDGSMAGVYLDWEEMCRTVTDFLDFRCRHRETGIPANRKSMIIDGVWVDGASLPATKTRSPQARDDS